MIPDVARVATAVAVMATKSDPVSGVAFFEGEAENSVRTKAKREFAPYIRA